MMTPTAERVLDFIRHNGHVSLVEIEHIAQKDGMATTGDLALGLTDPAVSNVCTWFGGSEAFIALLREIKPFTSVHPSSLLVYLIDGKVFKVPIARSVRHYKTPRWMPITLNARAGVPDGVHEG